jgi:hypothetical protein
MQWPEMLAATLFGTLQKLLDALVAASRSLHGD